MHGASSNCNADALSRPRIPPFLSLPRWNLTAAIRPSIGGQHVVRLSAGHTYRKAKDGRQGPHELGCREKLLNVPMLYQTRLVLRAGVPTLGLPDCSHLHTVHGMRDACSVIMPCHAQAVLPYIDHSPHFGLSKPEALLGQSWLRIPL